LANEEGDLDKTQIKEEESGKKYLDNHIIVRENKKENEDNFGEIKKQFEKENPLSKEEIQKQGGYYFLYYFFYSHSLIRFFFYILILI